MAICMECAGMLVVQAPPIRPHGGRRQWLGLPVPPPPPPRIAPGLLNGPGWASLLPAIPGGRRATFGGFSHEGTGVKVRDWNPFESWQGQRAVYALRLEPGPEYDTFHGYYFDEARSAWRLFASGKKRARERALETLFVGSFVEVPGPPGRPRTGHRVRTMRYRGHACDAAGRWHPLTHMKGEGRPGELRNRSRGATGDGRLWMSTGGMEHHGPNPEVRIEPAADPPPWLRPEVAAPLFTTPCEVTLLSLVRRGPRCELRLRVRGAGKGARATLHFGRTEGLSFAERWEHSLPMGAVGEGELEFVWTVEPGDALRARVLVESELGRFWSTETITEEG